MSAQLTPLLYSAGPDRPLVRKLTRRQQECLALAAEHLTSKEIAQRLGISPHTVDQCFRRSIRALQARDRRDAVRLMKDFVVGVGNTAKARPTLIAAELPLPFATATQPRNRMAVGWRFAWIMAIAALTTIGTAMYLAGLESLSRMLH